MWTVNLGGNMLREELARYFDKLRFERGFSQERFVDDIISLSQFKRYLKGKNAMPLRIIVELSNQLGLKYDYVLDEFDLAKNDERKAVTKMMNLIVNYDYESFESLVKDLDPDFIIEHRNKLIFNYTIILKDLFQKKISSHDALSQLKRLINFPRILDIKSLSVSEFMILGEIATMLPIDEQPPVFDRLKRILKKPGDVISGNNEKLVIMLLVRIIKILGANKKFDDALFYCDVGINICKSIRTFYSLEYLYYYASLCHHHFGNIEKRNEMIYLTYVAASIDGNHKKLSKFINLLEKDYQIIIADFITDHFKT